MQLSAAIVSVAGMNLAVAQQAPLEQVRILVGFPPGGGTDIVARRIADGIRGSYARTAVVENKPGVGARLALEDVRRGPIDGSLLTVHPDSVITQQLHVDPKNTRFKYEDFTPVASVAQVQHALAVGPMVPESVRTVRDFINWANANPKSANYGTPGPNSPQDFLMKTAMKNNGFNLTHVPYKGSAPGVQDLLAGQIAAFVSPVGDSLQHVASGKLRILGTSGAQRSRFTPNVPTFKEQGFSGMELTDRFGVWVKTGVPEATLDQLHAAIQRVLGQQELIDFLGKVGLEVDPIPRAAVVRVSRESYDAWGERVRITGYQPE